MKQIKYISMLLLILISASTINAKKTVQQIAEFQGQQVTGLAISNEGRIFVNFPRWRMGVESSVIEINKDGEQLKYPNDKWNAWEMGKDIKPNTFIAVQSMIANEDKLYVLDTRNPNFQGTIDAPRLFIFNLKNNKLVNTIKLSKGTYCKTSYINDLRIDRERNKIYMTDSGRGGLIILDLNTGTSRRILDKHRSTTAEVNHLTINGTKWNNIVHSDGVAFNTKNNKLYFHALTAYTLYAIDVNLFNQDGNTIQLNVERIATTVATDGMMFDRKGNLYYADLENHRIDYLSPSGKIKTLYQGNDIKWADSFAIYKGFLYFTNSRINEAGEDISNLSFTLNRIKL